MSTADAGENYGKTGTPSCRLQNRQCVRRTGSKSIQPKQYIVMVILFKLFFTYCNPTFIFVRENFAKFVKSLSFHHYFTL